MPTGGLVVPLSGDAAFGGDAALLNPEQLLVLAAASCQLLSFLAVAAGPGSRCCSTPTMRSARCRTSARPIRLTGIRLRPQITVVPTG